MIIQDVPKEFQPKYISTYPVYSSGKNIEEIFYDYFTKEKERIDTDYVYLPIFWTSYYIINNYGKNIKRLLDWLDNIDTTKKYFTVVQYDSGICVNNLNIPITVFSAGGGGKNNQNTFKGKAITYANLHREIYEGSSGDFIIPLTCQPEFSRISLKKTIFCSFVGRLDTHFCRYSIFNTLKRDKKFKFVNNVNIEMYKKILNSSIFTLAPRGYGFTSFRLYEAIFSGSIPIYVWYDKLCLPFQEELKWDKFSVIIHSDDINKLPKILEDCNINEMQKELEKVRDKFKFDSTFSYILRKIKRNIET